MVFIKDIIKDNIDQIWFQTHNIGKAIYIADLLKI